MGKKKKKEISKEMKSCSYSRVCERLNSPGTLRGQLVQSPPRVCAAPCSQNHCCAPARTSLLLKIEVCGFYDCSLQTSHSLGFVLPTPTSLFFEKALQSCTHPKPATHFKKKLLQLHVTNKMLNS